MAALIDTNHDPPLRDFHPAGGLHETAVPLCGRRLLQAPLWLAQPPGAAVGRHGQRGIQIHLQPHLTRQTIQVEEVHRLPQPVLHPVAARLRHDQPPRRLPDGVGQEQPSFLPAWAGHRQLPDRPLVPRQPDTLVHITNVLRAALRRVADRLRPRVAGQATQTPEESRPPPSACHEPDATPVPRAGESSITAFGSVRHFGGESVPGRERNRGASAMGEWLGDGGGRFGRSSPCCATTRP